MGLPSHILKEYFQEKKWEHLKSHKSIKWCNEEAALLWQREVTSKGGWKLCSYGKGRLNLVTKLTLGAMGSLSPATRACHRQDSDVKWLLLHMLCLVYGTLTLELSSRCQVKSLPVNLHGFG